MGGERSQTTDPLPTRTKTHDDEIREAVIISAVLAGVLGLMLTAAKSANKIQISSHQISSHQISSELHSFSLSQSENSSSTICDIVFSVGIVKSPGHRNNLYVDMPRASVFYEKHRILVQYMDPFYVMEEAKIHANFSATFQPWVQGYVGFKTSINQTVQFEFLLEAVAKFSSPENDPVTKGLLEIYCNPLNLQFFSSTIQMVAGPMICNTTFSGR